MQDRQWLLGKRDWSFPTHHISRSTQFENDVRNSIGNDHSASGLENSIRFGRQCDSEHLRFAMWKNRSVGAGV